MRFVIGVTQVSQHLVVVKSMQFECEVTMDRLKRIGFISNAYAASKSFDLEIT
jgi:hypothetical protein